MHLPRYKLVLSTTKEEIGVEYLTVDGWKNIVFDYPERDGVFNQRELGDGFLGVVHRRLCTGRTLKSNGEYLYVGDEITPGNFVEFSFDSFNINGDLPIAAFAYLFS